MMADSATGIQDMLRAFMADGGTVMCGACSAAAGLTKADYIDGVVMGEGALVEGRLFRDGMQTLSRQADMKRAAAQKDRRPIPRPCRPAASSQSKR